MYWTCEKCGERWPKYTTIDAYFSRKKAQEVHPGERCKPPKYPFNVAPKELQD